MSEELQEDSGASPLTPTPTESAVARLLRQEAERKRSDAEYEAQRVPLRQKWNEFRTAWDAAWVRLLRAFDYSRGCRLADAPGAAAALAEVGELVAELPGISWFPEPKPFEHWLRHLANYDRWHADGPCTTAALLLDALRGGSAEELAEQLTHVDDSEALRTGFAWFAFFQDCLLPRPAIDDPDIPVGKVFHGAEPFGECSTADMDYVEQVLLSGPPVTHETPIRRIEEAETQLLSPVSLPAEAGTTPVPERNEPPLASFQPQVPTTNIPAQAQPPVLDHIEADILIAMLRLNATAQSRRRKRDEVAKDINRLWNYEKVARQFQLLRDLKYTASVAGPQGGVWLTITGRQRAEDLKSAEGQS